MQDLAWTKTEVFSYSITLFLTCGESERKNGGPKGRDTEICVAERSAI